MEIEEWLDLHVSFHTAISRATRGLILSPGLERVQTVDGLDVLTLEIVDTERRELPIGHEPLPKQRHWRVRLMPVKADGAR